MGDNLGDTLPDVRRAVRYWASRRLRLRALPT